MATAEHNMSAQKVKNPAPPPAKRNTRSQSILLKKGELPSSTLPSNPTSSQSAQDIPSTSRHLPMSPHLAPEIPSYAIDILKQKPLIPQSDYQRYFDHAVSVFGKDDIQNISLVLSRLRPHVDEDPGFY